MLVPLVYEELRQVARRQLARESHQNTLSATALVHEVYLRLLHQPLERARLAGVQTLEPRGDGHRSGFGHVLPNGGRLYAVS